ncbi:MAG: diacylglycerol/lipid kinase family protein [Solirubrobacterales bacterium]
MTVPAISVPKPPAEPAPVEAPLRHGPGSAKKRMLIIVNPYATTVSDRLKNLVVYALQGRYDVEAVSTQAQNHATEIGREARDGGYDVVVAFGGDGTVNEVANGLAGTDVPISVLPGGSTNVVCRTLGIPNDVVDATEHLLGIADDFRPRRVDLGQVDGRHFVFSCGAGLDASVTERVDAKPGLKAKAGPYYYSWAALSSYYRRYLRNPVLLRVQAGEREVEGITALTQNSDPYTYFASRPIRVCEGIELDDGTLSMAVLRRAAQRDAPTLIARLFSGRLTASQHRQIEQLDDLHEATITSISTESDGSPRLFKLQVDGDYIGEQAKAELRVDPGALTVVA